MHLFLWTRLQKWFYFWECGFQESRPLRSSICILREITFFFKNLKKFIYLFLATLSLSCWVGCLHLQQVGATLGFSCCRAQALGMHAQFWSTGLAALQHVGSSWTRDQCPLHWQADSLALEASLISTREVLGISLNPLGHQLFHLQKEVTWLQGSYVRNFSITCLSDCKRIPWTARRSNQSILKEISPEFHWK